MRGLIVYDADRLKKNRFFADSLRSAFVDRGVHADIVLKPEKCDFAIMRTVDELYNEQLDKSGVRTFNCSFTASICNDKYGTYEFLCKKGIPCVPTFLSSDGLSYPFVAKSRGGHGGSEVYLINNQDDLKRVAAKDIIYQPLTGERGRDMRVYVMGGKIIKAMLRYSSSDFRANYSLGGSYCEVELNDKQKEIAIAVAEGLKADFVGVDMFFTPQGAVVNEAEDVVGCRMLYGKTDIYALYADYVLKTLEK